MKNEKELRLGALSMHLPATEARGRPL